MAFNLKQGNIQECCDCYVIMHVLKYIYLTFLSCCSVVKMRSSLLTGLVSRAASGRSFSTSVALNDKIKEFVVIGGGLMGAGIAQVKTHNMPLHVIFFDGRKICCY